MQRIVIEKNPQLVRSKFLSRLFEKGSDYGARKLDIIMYLEIVPPLIKSSATEKYR